MTNSDRSIYLYPAVRFPCDSFFVRYRAFLLPDRALDLSVIENLLRRSRDLSRVARIAIVIGTRARHD